MKNPFEVYNHGQGLKGTRSLDWDESAADTNSKIEGFFEESRQKTNLNWFSLIFVLSFLILGIKLFYLQILQGQNFRLLAEGNRVRQRVLLAPRGLISDRNGENLAQNTPGFNLVVVPFDLPKESLDEEISKLVSLFSFDESEIRRKIANSSRNSFEPILVKSDLTAEQSILFETKNMEFPGFSIQTLPVRDYLNPEAFSHVLGYSGVISEGEYKILKSKGYVSEDYIGKTGIEQIYEQHIKGINGKDQIEVDAFGKVVKVLGKVEPKPGNTVQLNINKGLQEQLYNSFTSIPNSKGAVVAMNPKTGEVLALVSVPGFEANKFAHGIKPEEYQKLLDDKNLPLFNRAIAGTYPPGSTVKPMVALVALQEGIVTPNTVIHDRGVLVIPNQFNPQISYNFYGWKRDGLGPMTVRSAIAESSDIYFYTVSGGHPSSTIKGLGAERLAKYYRDFNLGKIEGIDIPGEKPGLVADPNWKARFFKDDAILSKWYLGDTYHIGIGQGDMLVTPLQVAVWTAAIANNGIGMKPIILKRVLDSSGKLVLSNKPEVNFTVNSTGDNLKVVQEGMRQTVLSGSGRSLLALPVSAAGKTGTSQFDGSDPSRTHAWFTAYAPFEDPEIVITVLVEAGGEGHAAAVPIVKNALQWWSSSLGKK